MTIGGAILAEHVKSLDWKARRADFADAAPVAIVDDVIQKLGTLLS